MRAGVCLARRFSAEAPASTPALNQWKKIKKTVPEHLLLFRVGDFYEAFFEDAQMLSSVCSVVLTRRGKGAVHVPMAGVPVHAVDQYIAKLLAEGKTVAVADQVTKICGAELFFVTTHTKVETPEEAKAAGKKIVDRKISRIVTPGTTLEDELLAADRPSYLLALSKNERGLYEVCWTDVSAGHSGRKVLEDASESFSLILSLNAREILFHSSAKELAEKVAKQDRSCRMREFASGSCEEALQGYVKSSLQLGLEEDVNFSWTEESHDYLVCDQGTRDALDLMKTSTGISQGSLIHVFVSSGHSYLGPSLRLLRHRLNHPLAPSEALEIQSRLDAVKFLMDDQHSLRLIKKTLQGTAVFGDSERALQRLVLNVQRSNLHLARDIRSVVFALEMVSDLQKLGLPLPERWKNLRIGEHLRTELSRILAVVGEDEDVCVVEGADPLLDSLRNLAHLDEELAVMEKELSDALGVPLKVVKGRFHEIYFVVTEKFSRTVSQIARDVPGLGVLYVGQRANSTRWTTKKLEEIGTKYSNVENDCDARMEFLLRAARKTLLTNAAAVHDSLRAMYDLDMMCGVAWTALHLGLHVPTITSSMNLDLKGLFHPVLRHLYKQVQGNNVHLSRDLENSVFLITGPNMGGKTTLLRSVALACWLTSCGFPCGVVSCDSVVPLFQVIFVRCGASDDISRDRSTFFVEMQGLAEMLQYVAKSKSTFVALDELGRNTQPADGASIAAAVMRRISRSGSALTLIATHYCDIMNRLWENGELPRTSLKHLEVIKRDNQPPVFTHRLKDGPAFDSHSLYVAELAGVCSDVIEDARKLKPMVENKD